MTFSLKVTCDSGDTIEITTEESAGSKDSDSTEVDCVGSNITIIKDAPGGTSSDESDFVISGDNSCDELFTLEDNEEVSFGCDFSNET